MTDGILLFVLAGATRVAVQDEGVPPGPEGDGTRQGWEITLLTFPVVVGQGRRLFPDSGQDAALELVDSHATANGVTSQVYRMAGRPQYG